MAFEDEPSLEPLKITCTTASCEDGLHCFLTTKRLAAQGRADRCRYCEADLVDWQRVRGRSLDDLDYTTASLQHEFIRHHFWHAEFDQKAVNHARRKGRTALFSDVSRRIKSSVGPASHPREGRQTPWMGNLIYYAQHAVAACCRRCIEQWHGIEPGRELNEAEVGYLEALARRYLEQRLPDLRLDGVYVPRIAGGRVT